jgi:predicted transcriptional regulator
MKKKIYLKEKIFERILEKNLMTKKELAKKLNIPLSYFYGLTTGRLPIGMKTAKKIQNFFKKIDFTDDIFEF